MTLLYRDEPLILSIRALKLPFYFLGLGSSSKFIIALSDLGIKYCEPISYFFNFKPNFVSKSGLVQLDILDIHGQNVISQGIDVRYQSNYRRATLCYRRKESDKFSAVPSFSRSTKVY